MRRFLLPHTEAMVAGTGFLRQHLVRPALFFGLVLLLLAGAAAHAAEPAPAGNLFQPSRLSTSSGSMIDTTDFANALVCAACHPGIYYQWNGSMHSLAHPDPLYMRLSLMASRETDGLTDRFCAGCHTPLAVAGGEVPPPGNPLMSRVGAEGVTCDFCHSVAGSTGIGNLTAIIDPGSVKYGPRRDAQSPFHRIADLELLRTPEFCGMCHQVSHPVNGLPIEQTYSEWKEGPYNNEDPALRVTCQDCHMRQVPGTASTGMTARPANRGKSAVMGPLREHVPTHYFVGGNTAMTSRFGAGTHSSMAEERLRAAATLAVTEADWKGNELRFTVRVTNDGAGHYLPTGLTEARRIWIETSVVADDGQVLFSSGVLDDRGLIPPEATWYGTILGDAENRPTELVWEGASILEDRRIAPKGQHETVFSAPRSGGKGPVTVRARLLYRSYGPHLAELAFGEGAPAAEAVVMATTERRVETK